MCLESTGLRPCPALEQIVTGIMPVTRGNLPEPSVPDECPQDVLHLIHACTAADPGLRPTAKQVSGAALASVSELQENGSPPVVPVTLDWAAPARPEQPVVEVKFSVMQSSRNVMALPLRPAYGSTTDMCGTIQTA